MANANDTITLVLNGEEVSLKEFAKAIGGLSSLLDVLHQEVAKGSKIQWYVEGLEAGSAIATVKCVEDGDTGAVDTIVRAYEDAGRSFKERQRTGISDRADRSMKKIVGLINSRIRSVRFETRHTDVEIFQPGTGPPKRCETLNAIGTVQGRIESLSKRKRLRFTLYESHTERPISCYLAPGSEETMRKAWGKLAIIEGDIRRDPTTGLPTTVRDVTDIKVLPERDVRDVTTARGAYKSIVSELPETTIRRLRDG